MDKKLPDTGIDPLKEHGNADPMSESFSKNDPLGKTHTTGKKGSLFKLKNR